MKQTPSLWDALLARLCAAAVRDAERSAYLHCADFCTEMAFHGQDKHRTARLLLADTFRNWSKGLK